MTFWRLVWSLICATIFFLSFSLFSLRSNTIGIGVKQINISSHPIWKERCGESGERARETDGKANGERRGATQSPPLLFNKYFPEKITFNPFCSCVFLILFFWTFFYFCLFIVVNDMAKESWEMVEMVSKHTRVEQWSLLCWSDGMSAMLKNSRKVKNLIGR